MKLLRYMERTGTPYFEAIRTPNEFIEHAFVIWSLDAIRDKLKAKREQQ